MKIFIREHVPFFICASIQSIFIFLVYWLSGNRARGIPMYAVFLSLFVSAGYLFYQYFSRQLLYRRMEKKFVSLDESMHRLDQSVMSREVSALLKRQYYLYYKKISESEQKKIEHFTFMNQWVHQMKTPISVIELIIQAESLQGISRSIQEELDRMKKGLEMVLYMARLENFEQDFQVDKISMLEMVQRVVNENKRFFIGNQVYPDVKIDPSFEIETDPKWIRFVLNQVISNAIKYSSGQHKKVTIISQGTTLTIIDEGIGIPKSDIYRVFRPFFTGENGRKFKESTGMGLYLAHEIIERLNHHIEIVSEVGKGTTVNITFN